MRTGAAEQDVPVAGTMIEVEGQGESEVMAPRDQSAEAMLMNAMDATLNRLRVLAREVCRAAKLEALVSKAFNDFSNRGSSQPRA